MSENRQTCCTNLATEFNWQNVQTSTLFVCFFFFFAQTEDKFVSSLLSPSKSDRAINFYENQGEPLVHGVCRWIIYSRLGLKSDQMLYGWTGKGCILRFRLIKNKQNKITTKKKQNNQTKNNNNKKKKKKKKKNGNSCFSIPIRIRTVPKHCPLKKII